MFPDSHTGERLRFSCSPGSKSATYDCHNCFCLRHSLLICCRLCMRPLLLFQLVFESSCTCTALQSDCETAVYIQYGVCLPWTTNENNNCAYVQLHCWTCSSFKVVICEHTSSVECASSCDWTRLDRYNIQLSLSHNSIFSDCPQKLHSCRDCVG